MTAVLMTDLMFPERDFAAPMDAEALRSYPVLERLGFFPVQRETYGGVRAFLHTSRELLKSPKTILWLTPTGQFHDARQPRPFLNGLSCLVDHDFPGSAVPVAIEYTFWNERSPWAEQGSEASMIFGEGSMPECKGVRFRIGTAVDPCRPPK
jgi:hypothetical protein